MLVQMVPIHVAMYYNPELSLCHCPKWCKHVLTCWAGNFVLLRQWWQHDSWLLERQDSDLSNKTSHWQHIRGVWDPLYSIFFTFSLDLVAACTTLLAPLPVPKLAGDYSRQHTKPWRRHLHYKSKYTSCFCSRQLWRHGTSATGANGQTNSLPTPMPLCKLCECFSFFLFYSQQL